MTKYLYLIVGPSGSGKTTLQNNLVRYFKDIRPVISYTTRPPRYDGETGHYFVTDEVFDSLGKMVAYTEFNGHRYGVVAEKIDAGDVYVIDPSGVEYLKSNYVGPRQFKVIWLYVSEEEAARRMRLRGDSRTAISSRIENDRKIFSAPEIADKIVYTDYKTEPRVAREVARWIKKKEN